METNNNIESSEKEKKAKELEPVRPQWPLFSFFSRPVSNTKPSRNISIPQLYALIKGDRYAKRTEKLREIFDPKAARAFKANNFDYVTFSGIFSNRADQALEKHSGYMVFDFDHVTDPDALEGKLLFLPGIETQLSFISPSGNGYKWVIEADLNELTHQEFFDAVASYLWHTLGATVDPSGRDVSRACFLCHDPDVYIHPKYLK